MINGKAVIGAVAGCKIVANMRLFIAVELPRHQRG